MFHHLLWKQFVNPRSLVMTSESLFQFCAYWIPIKPSVSANLTENMTTWKALMQHYSRPLSAPFLFRTSGFSQSSWLDSHDRKSEQDIERVTKLYLWCTRCIRIRNLSIILIVVSNILSFACWFSKLNNNLMSCESFLCNWGQIYLGWRSARGEWALIRSHLSHGKHGIFERYFLVEMK